MNHVTLLARQQLMFPSPTPLFCNLRTESLNTSQQPVLGRRNHGPGVILSEEQRLKDVNVIRHGPRCRLPAIAPVGGEVWLVRDFAVSAPCVDVAWRPALLSRDEAECPRVWQVVVITQFAKRLVIFALPRRRALRGTNIDLI